MVYSSLLVKLPIGWVLSIIALLNTYPEMPSAWNLPRASQSIDNRQHAKQVPEDGESDSKYLARQQAAVDAINKRGLALVHACIQVRMAATGSLAVTQCIRVVPTHGIYSCRIARVASALRPPYCTQRRAIS